MESGDEDIERDFNRIKGIVTTNGYREGVLEGSEAIYQKCFDVSYSQGYEMGFALGFYKAVANFAGETRSTDSSILETDVKKSHCVICKDERLLNSSSDEIVKKQQKENDDTVKKLTEQYESKLNELGMEYNIKALEK